MGYRWDTEGSPSGETGVAGAVLQEAFHPDAGIVGAENLDEPVLLDPQAGVEVCFQTRVDGGLGYPLGYHRSPSEGRRPPQRLVEQGFVKDPDKSVREVLAAAGKAAGQDVRVASFVRFKLGEAAES